MVALLPSLALSFTPDTALERSARISLGRAEARHDAGLVRRFNAGDASAFSEIAARYRKKMFSVAFARLRNQGDAEEVAQDTLIRAHRSLGSFRGDSSLSTWLHRIAFNLALNRYWYFFRRCRHATQSLDRPLREGSTSTLAEMVASEEPGPVGEAATRELAVLVAACMKRLPASHFEILRLRTTLDLSYEEIAARLHINVGTVKSRIARARGRLRALLDQASDEVPLGAGHSPRV